MRTELANVAKAATPTHLHLRERIGRILAVTIGIDAVGSVLVYFFERHADRTEITTLGDAVFWTTTQLLTVSSQLHNPITTGGRVVDVFLQLWAISVVAALAGAFGAFFHRRGLERDPI
jgi:ion channel